MSLAEILKGPAVHYEKSSSSKTSVDQHRLQRQRFQLDAKIPVIKSQEGHNFIATLEYSHDRRLHDLNNSKPTQDTSNIALGGIYLFKNPKFSPFLWISRFQDPIKPQERWMYIQYFAGINIDDFLPYEILGIKSKTNIAYRIRLHPTHTNYLFYLAEDIFWQSWRLLLSSSGVKVEWYGKNYDWSAYGGIVGESRDFQGKWQQEEVWLIGSVINAYLGTRTRIHKILFLSFDLGMQSENMRFLGKDNGNRFSYDSKFSPWFRMGIETWISP